MLTGTSLIVAIVKFIIVILALAFAGPFFSS